MFTAQMTSLYRERLMFHGVFAQLHRATHSVQLVLLASKLTARLAGDPGPFYATGKQQGKGLTQSGMAHASS